MTTPSVTASNSVRPEPLPPGALLHKYRDTDAYTDCYATDLPSAVSFSDFVAAFYTTPLFKVERMLLGLAASRPSTDAQAQELGRGETERFAAWRVEDRATDQLLLSDYSGRTRSWLMVAPVDNGYADFTRLYFGSAVVRVEDPRSGERKMGIVFRALLGFHRLYARLLLQSARARLMKQHGSAR